MPPHTREGRACHRERAAAGAAKLGLPSRVRGVPGVGKFNHCANAPLASSVNKTNSRQ